MFIADEEPTDKPRFKDHFKTDFEPLRRETLEWLKSQPLAMFGFSAGQSDIGVDAIVIAPPKRGVLRAGAGVAAGDYSPRRRHRRLLPLRAATHIAPPFRHTHFSGKQVVLHSRTKTSHDLFSYNRYPGPSAKKGIYGVLLGVGERENWVTAHCSTVQVVTPYDNVVTIMHEGASGGGKSEMLEQVHREPDGRLILGENIYTGEKRYLEIPRACELLPVTDDMALCHPSHQNDGGKLVVQDAENSWFVRVNHIDHYGVDIHLDRAHGQCLRRRCCF